MQTRVVIWVSCLVASLGLAACSAESGSPLQASLEAPAGDLQIADAQALVANDGPMPQKAASAVNQDFVADIIFNHELIMPTNTFRYAGNVTDTWEAGMPNATLLMNTGGLPGHGGGGPGLGGGLPPAPTRAYYMIKDLGKNDDGTQKFLDKLNIRGIADDLQVGVWYRTAAESAWGLHSVNYDWFAPQDFAAGKNFYLSTLPHQKSSTFLVKGVRYAVIVLQALPGHAETIRSLDLWAK